MENLPVLVVHNAKRRVPWNKGKLVGAKPPLKPSHVWSIRTKLQIDGKKRDLALFNLAIDSKLRGCDVVAVRVDDVAPNGYTLDRATIRQRKTGRPVRFEVTEHTRHAIDAYLRETGRQSGQYLFAGRGDGGAGGLTARQYARLVGEWIASISQACEGAPWVIKAVDLAVFDKTAGAPRPVTPNGKQQASDFQ